MTSRRMAKKVQEYWNFKLIKNELDFLGRQYSKSPNISDYVFSYRKFIENRKSESACSVAKGVFKQFQIYLNNMRITRLDEISVSVMDRYIDKLSNRLSAKTIKNHFNTISQFFDKAIKEDLIKSNPSRLATLPKVEKVVKHRSFGTEDINVIFENAGGYWLYYLFLYHTGLRSSDVDTLTFGNIDRSRKIITKFIRKSRRIHEFPLSNALLRATPEGNSNQPIFPSLYAQKSTVSGVIEINENRLHHNLSKPRKYLQAILTAADRPWGTLHSFRVTYNNSLRDLGLSILDRQVLLAHSSTSTTQIYTHPNIELARKYVNKLPCPIESN